MRIHLLASCVLLCCDYILVVLICANARGTPHVSHHTRTVKKKSEDDVTILKRDFGMSFISRMIDCFMAEIDDAPTNPKKD